MKILAIADRQFNLNLIELIEKNNIELVILLGDLKYIDLYDLENSPVLVIGVLGNHCGFDYFENLKAINLHKKKILYKNYVFLGYQGCPLYKGGEYESTQEDCSLFFEKASKCDILISHSPAKYINSTNDKPHDGFLGIYNYILKHNPKFFFHGHSYPDENQKISKLNDTIIYYVNGVEIIDLSLIDINTLPKVKEY